MLSDASRLVQPAQNGEDQTPSSAGGGPRGRRRSLLAALLLATLLPTGVSAQAGAARAVQRTRAMATDQRSAGHYDRSVATFRALEGRDGPLYWLSRDSIHNAGWDADATLVLWAEALAQQGDVERALALVDQMRSPALGAAAGHERASLLLSGANAALRSGNTLVALQRTDQLASMMIPTDLTREVASLTSRAQLAAAPQLITAGRPAAAVTALDGVLRRDPGSSEALQAGALMPHILLDAARVSLAQFNGKQATAMLERLTREYGQTPEARSGDALLIAGQNVGGTVVRRSGTPLSGPLRLAGHFVQSGHGDYATGPFFPGRANDGGDFLIANVPVGGPYVLEIMRDGIWVTPIDRDTGGPAYVVTVASLKSVDLGFVIVPS